MNNDSKKQQTLSIMRKLKGHGIDLANNRKSIVEQEFGADEDSEEQTPDSETPETEAPDAVPSSPQSEEDNGGEGERKFSKRAVNWLKSQYKPKRG